MKLIKENMLLEKRWLKTIDGKVAKRFHQVLDNDDSQNAPQALKDLLDKILEVEPQFKEDYDNLMDELSALGSVEDYDNEGEFDSQFNYIVDLMYDYCDEHNIWIDTIYDDSDEDNKNEIDLDEALGLKENNNLSAKTNNNINEDFDMDKFIAEHDDSFKYQLLDRMKGDCEYYIANKENDENNHLWVKNAKDHIEYMKKLYNSFDEKPEWLTMQDIENFEKRMLDDTDTENLDEATNDRYTIEIDGKILTDDFGEPYHFDSYKEAQEYIEEEELENASVTRQYGLSESAKKANLDEKFIQGKSDAYSAKENNKNLEEAATGKTYHINWIDGNAAASRGTEPDHAVTSSLTANSDDEAIKYAYILRSVCEIDDISNFGEIMDLVNDYGYEQDEIDDLLNIPDYREALDNINYDGIDGGDPWIHSIVDPSGNVIYEEYSPDCYDDISSEDEDDDFEDDDLEEQIHPKMDFDHEAHYTVYKIITERDFTLDDLKENELEVYGSSEDIGGAIDLLSQLFTEENKDGVILDNETDEFIEQQDIDNYILHQDEINSEYEDDDFGSTDGWNI